MKAENVKENAIVIDVGTNLDDNLPDKIYGDVDFESVKDKVSAITPVLGGVWTNDSCLFIKKSN